MKTSILKYTTTFGGQWSRQNIPNNDIILHIRGFAWEKSGVRKFKIRTRDEKHQLGAGPSGLADNLGSGKDAPPS